MNRQKNGVMQLAGYPIALGVTLFQPIAKSTRHLAQVVMIGNPQACQKQYAQAS